MDKLPINRDTLAAHDAHDPAIWMDAPTAFATASQFGESYGVGFVFTDQDPFWFLDIDHCITNGVYSPVAQEMMTLLPGAVEVSQSGTGLHIFGTGACPPHGTRNSEFGLEFYTTKRFVALTGNMVSDHSADLDASLLLPGLVASYFPPPATTTESADWTTGPVPEWSGPTDDDQLITQMLRSKPVMQAFGGGCTVSDLWNANVTVLSATYPDPARDYDASSADMALASHLAFWTGKDCARIERLMRRSALARDKWDRRGKGLGYLRTTIVKAVSLCTDVYGASTRPAPPSTTNSR